MPAYMIFLRDHPVHNPDELTKYQQKARENVGDFKLTMRVLYGRNEALEGGPADGIVMLEFPTVEDAKAWYHSPGYQAAARHRKMAADYRVLLVEGV